MNTTYPPLEEARKNLHVKWYRCPVPRDRLLELSQRSDLKGWFQSLGHLILFACTATLTYFLFLQQHWVLFAVSLYLHSVVTSFFAFPNHELGHGTVFKTRWLNRFFLWIYCVLGYHNHRDYAMSHTYHHRYTLHPDGDREVLLPKLPTFNPLYLLQLLTFNFTGGFESSGLIPVMKRTIWTAFGKFPGDNEWIEAVYEDCPEERVKAVNNARVILLFHLSVLVVAIVFKLWLLPLLFTFSFFIGGIWRYLCGAPMHCGLRDNIPDFRLCVRSIKLDPLSQFLYWHMNWHAEHHMYAGVPCYNLKKLSREIADDMPKPRTMIGAWREMRETYKRQLKDPSYQFDTPLPETAGRLPPEDQDPLDTSIGDLAPEVLS